MSRINVKLNDVQSGFEVYPDGLYLVEIQESSKTKKSKAGNLMILWIGKITEGEYENKLISWNTVLTEEALWNLKAMLEAVGLEWDEDGFELEDAFGKELIIQNVSRTVDGREMNGIQAYFPADYDPDKVEEED